MVTSTFSAVVPAREGPEPTVPVNRGVRRPRGPLLVLLLPFLIFFLTFFVAPIIYAAGQSMLQLRTDDLGITPPRTVFVFLGNYREALGTPAFVDSIGRVVLFSVIEVPLMALTAVVLALILDSGRAAFPRAFRVVYFLPYGIPGVVATLLWGFLYIPATSPVLDLLADVGIDLHPLDQGSILFAIANISLWCFAGYNMLILIAALQSIPGELYDAARVDGAGELAIVRHIKLPLLRPTIILVVVFTIIGTLQLFVEPLVLQPLSTAIDSNFTPNLAAYNQAFGQSNPNLAAAMAVIVAVVGFAFSFGFLRLVNRKGNRPW